MRYNTLAPIADSVKEKLMNLIKRKGNVYLSPDRQPKPKPLGSPDGIRPQWDYDSQDNLDSWQGVFNDMARTYTHGECVTASADRAVTRKAKQAEFAKSNFTSRFSGGSAPKGSSVGDSEPTQVGLTKAGDELVILTAREKKIIVPVRKLRNDPRYAIMALPEALWKAYCTYRNQCQRLGFSALKQGPKWVLLWKPIGGTR